MTVSTRQPECRWLAAVGGLQHRRQQPAQQYLKSGHGPTLSSSRRLALLQVAHRATPASYSPGADRLLSPGVCTSQTALQQCQHLVRPDGIPIGGKGCQVSIRGVAGAAQQPHQPGSALPGGRQVPHAWQGLQTDTYIDLQGVILNPKLVPLWPAMAANVAHPTHRMGGMGLSLG